MNNVYWVRNSVTVSERAILLFFGFYTHFVHWYCDFQYFKNNLFLTTHVMHSFIIYCFRNHDADAQFFFKLPETI